MISLKLIFTPSPTLYVTEATVLFILVLCKPCIHFIEPIPWRRASLGYKRSSFPFRYLSSGNGSCNLILVKCPDCWFDTIDTKVVIYYRGWDINTLISYKSHTIILIVPVSCILGNVGDNLPSIFSANGLTIVHIFHQSCIMRLVNQFLVY